MLTFVGDCLIFPVSQEFDDKTIVKEPFIY